MAEKKSAKAPSKAKARKAAQAEAKAGPKELSWRGLTLSLPEDLPGELMFDFFEFEEQQRNEEGRIGPMFGLIRSLLGREQFQAVRDTVRGEKLSLDQTLDAISELLSRLLEQYGMGLGES